MKLTRPLSLVSKRFLLPKTVNDLKKSEEPCPNIELQGWVDKVHKSGKFAFVHVKDGLSSDTIQAVVPKELCADVSVGSGVAINGNWSFSSGGKQVMELNATTLKVFSKDSNPRYSTMSPDVLRKQIHVRSRSDSFASVLRMRSSLFARTHQYFRENQFVYVDTPLLTANDCEGAGETFVAKTAKDDDFFGEKKDVYLSVSSQLHLEAITSGISRVYTVSTGVRADKQQSSCHLSEFRMLEAEIAFCNSLNVLCDITEDYFRSLLHFCLSDATMINGINNLGSLSADNFGVLESIANAQQYPRISYNEAVAILSAKGCGLTNNGLTKQNELALVDYFKSPIFVTEFPSSQKPFYMKRTENNSETLSFDFLCPNVGELAGGSIREDDVQRLEERGNNIHWYMDCRRRGKPISAGFGMGFERLIQVMLGVRNIKDTVSFPRWYKHCHG